MAGISRRLRRQIYSATAVEGFVRLVVAGGIAVVVGLWIVRLAAPGSVGWMVGIGLLFVGIGALARGIWSEIDV